MSYVNIMVNGLKMPVTEKSTVHDIIEKFFDLRCEFLVSRNTKQISAHRYKLCRLKENDILQVITYSKECYKLRKRTIFKTEEKNNLK